MFTIGRELFDSQIGRPYTTEVRILRVNQLTTMLVRGLAANSDFRERMHEPLVHLRSNEQKDRVTINYSGKRGAEQRGTAMIKKIVMIKRSACKFNASRTTGEASRRAKSGGSKNKDDGKSRCSATATALKLGVNISFITPVKRGKKPERNENHIGMRARAIQF